MIERIAGVVVTFGFWSIIVWASDWVVFHKVFATIMILGATLAAFGPYRRKK